MTLTQETLVVALAAFVALTILYVVFVAPRVGEGVEDREAGE